MAPSVAAVMVCEVECHHCPALLGTATSLDQDGWLLWQQAAQALGEQRQWLVRFCCHHHPAPSHPIPSQHQYCCHWDSSAAAAAHFLMHHYWLLSPTKCPSRLPVQKNSITCSSFFYLIPLPNLISENKYLSRQNTIHSWVCVSLREHCVTEKDLHHQVIVKNVASSVPALLQLGSSKSHKIWTIGTQENKVSINILKYELKLIVQPQLFCSW